MLLDGYTLPMGLLVKPKKHRNNLNENSPLCSSNMHDKLILEYVLSKKMDWCIHNNTCKSLVKRNNKTRKRIIN